MGAKYTFRSSLGAKTLAFAVLVLAISGCASDQDDGGQALSLSKWKPAKVQELHLNTPLLTTKKIACIETQARGEEVFHTKISFDENRGRITTETAVDQVFNMDVKKQACLSA